MSWRSALIMAWCRFPAEMQQTDVDAGVLSLPELQDRLEKALEPFNYTKPAIARITGEQHLFLAGCLRPVEAGPGGDASSYRCGVDDAGSRGGLSRGGIEHREQKYLTATHGQRN